VCGELIGQKWEHNSPFVLACGWASCGVHLVRVCACVYGTPCYCDCYACGRHSFTSNAKITQTNTNHQSQTLKIKNKCWPFLTSRHIVDREKERKKDRKERAPLYHTPTSAWHTYVTARAGERCACALLLVLRYSKVWSISDYYDTN